MTTPTQVPSEARAPWQLSALELASLVQRRELSPVEIVESCIERIEEVNPLLCAVVATRYPQARAEARLAEQRAAAGERAPLLGVPCTIKEFLAVEGMPHTGGILARRAVRAERDATVVARLKAAGAIVLGVTNAPEGGLWPETNNPVYGRTHNPHDVSRTCGGSSGGEAALLAVGGAPFGLGSDAGGSIRIPAGFCGICGHKPTAGLVPNTGHFPSPPALPDNPLAVGPMARTIGDLKALLPLLAGPDGLDPRCDRSWSPGHPIDADAVDWSKVRVYALPTNGRFRPTAAVAASVNKAALALRERGATLVEWEGPDLSRALELWGGLMSDSGESYAELLGRPRVARQMLRWLVGRSEHSGGVLAVLVMERLVARFPGRSELAQAARQLRQRFDEALGPTGLLLHPVWPVPAPRHRGTALRPSDLGCTALFNVTESPVTALRVDTDPSGLPLGVQLVGARGQDALTLAAAEALQAVFGLSAPVDPRPAPPRGWRRLRPGPRPQEEGRSRA